MMYSIYCICFKFRIHVCQNRHESCSLQLEILYTLGEIWSLTFFQLLYEEVLSHNTLLDTITAKSSCISENFVTQLELQDLQERYNSVKDNAMVTKV